MTTPASHPSTAVLMDHAAGTLGMAHHLVVTTHALGCPECRAEIRLLDRIGSRVQRGWAGRPPPDALLARCLAGIAPPAGDAAPQPQADAPPAIAGAVLPATLAGLRPSRLRPLAPGLRHSTLWRDDRGTLHYVRVRPGVSLPAHDHRGLELTCVLSGAFHDDGGLHVAGDVTEEDGEAGHPRAQSHVVAAAPPDDCICIMATTGRMRFDGWLARLLQPVMPF